VINIPSKWIPIKYHRITCRCAGCMAKNGLAWNKGMKTGISSKRIDIEKELLISLYYGNHYTLQEIGNLFGCTKSCIMSCMKRQNIPRRDTSESRIGVTSGKNHPMYGKYHTRKSREMMSKTKKGVSLNHMVDCQCGVCKTKRGEIVGENHPNWKGGRKLSIKRNNAKRLRDLGFVQLFDNPFPKEVGIDYHHINDMLVVPFPRRIHSKKCGSQNRDMHRERANLWLYYLYGIDFDLLINRVE